MSCIAYFNGRVYTVDDQHPWAQAFIVSPSGIFTAVGSNDEILLIAKANGFVTHDLGDEFIMPGIHDAHTHLLLASMQKLNEIDIGSGSNSLTLAENIKQGQCACEYADIRGDWIIANFYAGDNFPNGKIDRDYLDDAFPTQPVIVRDISCHNIVMNTTGLHRAGYDLDASTDPPGGSFGRRPDGSLTGELLECASAQAWCSIPQPSISHVKHAISYGIQMSHRYGITSVQEASANTIYLEALRELEGEGRLSMNISTHIVHAPETFAAESQGSLHSLIDRADTYRSEHADTRFVKFWLDGAPIPPHFTQCDLRQDGCPDENRLLINRDQLLAALTKYDARGLTCKIHCAGEGSVRQALDVLEEVRGRNSNGPRHELAHCNAIHEGRFPLIIPELPALELTSVSPDDIPRLAKLRVTAEMSPAIFHETSLTSKYPKVFKWPFKELLEYDTHVTIGSDWILPPTPELFPALAAIFERLGSSPHKTVKQFGGQTLCRMITLGGAEAVGRAHELGSIEVGKKANFIAVNKDLSRGEFADATVLMTWFEGKLVWDRKGNWAVLSPGLVDSDAGEMDDAVGPC